MPFVKIDGYFTGEAEGMHPALPPWAKFWRYGRAHGPWTP